MPHSQPRLVDYTSKILAKNTKYNGIDEAVRWYVAAFCLSFSTLSDERVAAERFLKGLKMPDMQKSPISFDESTEIHVQSKQSIDGKQRYEVMLQADKQALMHLFFDLDAQANLLSVRTASIRVINDPILHQPGIIFPIVPSDKEREALATQIEIAKRVLIQTGGAGIAANQCLDIAHPYAFAIVGIFKRDEEHVRRVRARYPNTHFPEAMVMVNPKILAQSDDMQRFKHACLSVPSVNRCEVQSPEWIDISYLDAENALQDTTRRLEGTDAVVLWHEMQHILYGKTYFDVTIARLDMMQKQRFLGLVQEEQSRRMDDTTFVPDLTVTPQSFCYSVVYDSLGKMQLDEDAAKKALQKMSQQTLVGIASRLGEMSCKKNENIRVNRFFTNTLEQQLLTKLDEAAKPKSD